jgi:hypothetical protein
MSLTTTRIARTGRSSSNRRSSSRFAIATRDYECRVRRRDRLGGLLHEYELAA